MNSDKTMLMLNLLVINSTQYTLKFYSIKSELYSRNLDEIT